MIAVMVMGLSACAALYKGYATEPLTGQTSSLQTALTGGTNPLVINECFSPSVAPDKEGTCGMQRNKMIALLMAESVSLCTEHLKSIYGKEAAFNIAVGSVASLTSGLAAIGTGTGAATLALTSTFANSERSLVNETVYKNMLTTAIGTKIEEMRTLKGNALIQRKNEPYRNYTVEAAMADVLDYHDACSFYKGLQAALKEGTQNTPETKRNQLKTEADLLQQKINAYLASHTDLKSAFSSSPESIKDPILRSLLDDLNRVNQAMNGLSQQTLPSTKPPASNSTDVVDPNDIPASVLAQIKTAIRKDAKLLDEQLGAVDQSLSGAVQKLMDEVVSNLDKVKDPDSPDKLTQAYYDARQTLADTKDDNEQQIAKANIAIAQARIKQFKQKLNEAAKKLDGDERLAELRSIPKLVLMQDKEAIRAETKSLQERSDKLKEANKPLPAPTIKELDGLEEKFTSKLDGVKDPDNPEKLTQAYIAARKALADATEDSARKTATANLKAAIANNKQFKQKTAQVMKEFRSKLEEIWVAVLKKEAEKAAAQIASAVQK